MIFAKKEGQKCPTTIGVSRVAFRGFKRLILNRESTRMNANYEPFQSLPRITRMIADVPTPPLALSASIRVIRGNSIG